MGNLNGLCQNSRTLIVLPVPVRGPSVLGANFCEMKSNQKTYMNNRVETFEFIISQTAQWEGRHAHKFIKQYLKVAQKGILVIDRVFIGPEIWKLTASQGSPKHFFPPVFKIRLAFCAHVKF